MRLEWASFGVAVCVSSGAAGTLEGYSGSGISEAESGCCTIHRHPGASHGFLGTC